MNAANDPTKRLIILPQWLGNIRVPAETMRDMSDVQWLRELLHVYGEKRIHIGPPRTCEGVSACEWAERGMSGVYLKE